MRLRPVRSFCVALLALAAGGAAAQTQVPVPNADFDNSWQPALAGKALGDALRRGGYTLFFRHTVTDFNQQDQRIDGHGPCAEQRNLTDAGRESARVLGAEIGKAKVPVGEVLASPFCRTREAAQLMFGRAIVTDDVRGGPREFGVDVNKALLAILSTPPARGTNRAIVGHTNAFVTITRQPHLVDGECAVFEARPGGAPVVVAKIRPGDWAALGP